MFWGALAVLDGKGLKNTETVQSAFCRTQAMHSAHLRTQRQCSKLTVEHGYSAAGTLQNLETVK